MVKIQGLTLGLLADLYNKQTPEVQLWMRENLHLATGKEKSE